MKLLLFSALVVRLVLPVSGNIALDLGAFLAAVLLVAVAIGVLESSTARLQLPKVPRLLVTACLLSVFALVLVAEVSACPPSLSCCWSECCCSTS